MPKQWAPNLDGDMLRNAHGSRTAGLTSAKCLLGRGQRPGEGWAVQRPRQQLAGKCPRSPAAGAVAGGLGGPAPPVQPSQRVQALSAEA